MTLDSLDFKKFRNYDQPNSFTKQIEHLKFSDNVVSKT